MMRFPFFTGLSLLLFGVTLVIGYLILFSFGETERGAYWALMKQADPKQLEKTSPYKATQRHQHVCKEVWFLEKEQRMKLKVLSSDAELILDHQGDKTEVIELMHDVTCFMQEELYFVTPDGKELKKEQDNTFVSRDEGKKVNIDMEISQLKPMQVIRHLKAATAEYHYSTEQFVAHDVKVVRFVVPGHQLVESLAGSQTLLSGIAKKAEFSMAGGNTHFRAHQLKAKFHQRI